MEPTLVDKAFLFAGWLLVEFLSRKESQILRSSRLSISRTINLHIELKLGTLCRSDLIG